ncbi:NUDIX domain-containing protein [Phaeosphaeriaceae sp. PMI808]|nr:NUDIX domain-containing protein [Phaeosphaeriaceae sp. PMI808]
MTSTDKRLDFSDAFAISCGTVTIDSKRDLVLLILWRKTGEYFLPKGRKNIDETLNQTALRETYEETGISVQLLPVRMKTLATVSSPASDVVGPLTEPFAVAQRVTGGKLKLIFWYVAQGDSTKARVEGTQQENEEFNAIWVSYDEVLSTLSFDDDRQVANRAIGLAQATSKD